MSIWAHHRGSSPTAAPVQTRHGALVPAGAGVQALQAQFGQPQPIANAGLNPYQADILSTSRVSRSLTSAAPPAPNAWKSLPRGIQPARGPRTRFFDPLALVYATGFRDRRFSLTYDVLRRVSYQLSLIGAIIKVRVDQVAAFARPYRENKQIGFAIRHKNETHIPTEGERQAMLEMEQFVMNCGWGKNRYSQYPRENFGNFLKKFVRDSLTYDQGCFEVVPDTFGRPFEFRPVDAATIRLAATYDGYRGEEPLKFRSRDFTDKWKKEYGENFELDGEGVYTVQLLHGRIENIFTHNDMAFCIRNPRSDVWVNGYGFAEIEMCLNTVLRALWAEEYNARNFRQGSMAQGILNFKGDQFDPKEIEAFRRVWQSDIAGVENAHRVPVIQVPEGVEFVKMQNANSEMEYQRWLEYLIKIICSAYEIDPSEVNFDLVSGAGGSAGPLFESKHEWKIKHSKDKGLRPLLGWVAEQLSTYVIDPLDPNMYLDFVGLDQLTENDRIDLLTKKVSNYMTINEARQEEGLQPIKGGDIVNNPTFLQAYQGEQQAEADALAAMAPWMTSGDAPQPEYGEVTPVPLYMQEDGEQQQQPQEGMEGGEGGMPDFSQMMG